MVKKGFLCLSYTRQHQTKLFISELAHKKKIAILLDNLSYIKYDFFSLDQVYNTGNVRWILHKCCQDRIQDRLHQKPCLDYSFHDLSCVWTCNHQHTPSFSTRFNNVFCQKGNLHKNTVLKIVYLYPHIQIYKCLRRRQIKKKYNRINVEFLRFFQQNSYIFILGLRIYTYLERDPYHRFTK